MAQLAHHVFFTLTDSSEASVQSLIDAANKYLDGHDGVASFAVGRRCEDLVRDVNDQDFHVSLHVVFESRAAHDAYQVHPRHLQFIEEQKGNWTTARIFDSNLE
ncbi:Dabb family protein [Roseimaritima sediminicola]|uniref:Dabb family protein n=1 Tax=Roseimaritima sediminicola TaxID=2662066 RepID=UPI00129846CC|nr:Dabb family protein [Roseimaritima sediminicola]